MAGSFKITPEFKDTDRYGSWVQFALNEFCTRHGIEDFAAVDVYFGTHTFPNTSGIYGGVGGRALTKKTVCMVWDSNNATLYSDDAVISEVDPAHVYDILADYATRGTHFPTVREMRSLGYLIE